MNASTTNIFSKRDLQDQLKTAYSKIGFLRVLLNKLLCPDLSPLYVGAIYHRKLVTGIGSPETAFIPKLIKIAAQYPDCKLLHDELMNLQEILFEFFKVGALREDFDFNGFLKGDGCKPSPYDGHEALMLRDRLIESIKKLDLIKEQTFGPIDFKDGFNITLGGIPQHRDSYVLVKTSSLQVDFPKYAKRDPYIHHGKTALGK